MSQISSALPTMKHSEMPSDPAATTLAAKLLNEAPNKATQVVRGAMRARTSAASALPHQTVLTHS
jgi:hypothetical protein